MGSIVKRLSAVFMVLVLTSAGCLGGGSGSQTRTVLVDFSHDEFATFFLEYFPRTVTVRPGDTLVFRQTWTGEPHSVTLGTEVQEMGDLAMPIIELIRAEGFEAFSEEEVPPELDEKLEALPWMFTEGEDGGEAVAQNAAQPCYLETGLPPEDPMTPCEPEQRQQPPFSGRHSYYNSGFIPYEGPQGNTFTMPIADDAELGTYYYYCNLHGPSQSGLIEIVDEDTEIPSQNEVNRQARQEIEAQAGPLREEYEKAVAGEFDVPEEAVEMLEELGLVRRLNGRAVLDAHLSGVGLTDESIYVHGGVNEFVPRAIEADAGEEITWVILGGHTISFNVPRYFPIIEIDEDGTVRLNERLFPPAGGAPDLPAEPGPPDEGPEGPPDEGNGGPPGPMVIEADPWDGQGFWSSGMVWGEPFAVYKITVTEPGTYRYACLVHPPMIGTLTVNQT